MLDVIFWSVMALVILSGVDDAIIWWRVYQWKRAMRKDENFNGVFGRPKKEV